MIEESQIRRQLLKTAYGFLPLFEFSDWLESESENMHRDGTPRSIRAFVASIDRLIAEYEDIRDIKWLREQFVALLNSNLNVSLEFGDTGVVVSKTYTPPNFYSLNATWERSPLAYAV